MGSIVNGIALDTAMLRPYGSTFLIFSDYMRPAVRLSALMGLRNAGSGRTTRSASARTARRTSRSSTTWRCARSRTSGTSGPATRTRRRWRGASRSSGEDGPVALALTRQKLPTLRPHRGRAGGRRAARRLHALARGDGEPDAIVIATGSEVHVALEAARSLDAERARRLDAVLGALRGAGRRVPGVGAAAGGRGARVGRGRRSRSAGSATRSAIDRRSTASAPRRRTSGSSRSSGSRPRPSPPRSRRSSERVGR